jgi:steroid 5-alpha reductase family enzyme
MRAIYQRLYNMTTAALFLVFALQHLARIVFGLAVEIDGHAVPIWISAVAVAAYALWACFGLWLSRAAV